VSFFALPVPLDLAKRFDFNDHNVLFGLGH